MSAIRREDLARLIEKEQTPLQFLLKAMNNEKMPFDVRLEAAKSAAPYVHPRLNSIEAKIKRDVTDYTDADLALIAVAVSGDSGEAGTGEAASGANALN